MIEQGKIINQRDLQVNPCVIRMLDTNDLPQLMALQDFVLSLMKSRSFCVPLSPEEHYQIMSGSGESIGLFIGDRLYAVCSILFPGHREDNMARQLNFNDEELLGVAQLELSMVHPDLRGNNLQKRMADILARRAKKNYRYLFTTVSPYNYPSIKTVTSMGLHIAKLCNMYYRWARYVVYKDFIRPLKLDKSSIIQVPNTSFEEQQRLFDKGYFGFSQSRDEEGITIMFAKKLRKQH
ncbi:hypothetical protein [Desulfotomaculum sp. 1211_IL3151]|uniref:hypothetical protein n=1 Tax=Desulfotomaculum sp. 1211_IL3151 TaxID=3084055 RepID=UPI002FDB1726